MEATILILSSIKQYCANRTQTCAAVKGVRREEGGKRREERGGKRRKEEGGKRRKEEGRGGN